MEFEDAREDLVERLSKREALSDRVLDAIGAVPRHEFVPEEHRDRAYEDRPIPIGDAQTVSAPHMVAIMTDRLDPKQGEDVLEIGTGCGYHAAVTAELVGAEHVYSVEYSEDLAADARENLAGAGYGEVSVRVGDGRNGWPEYAPYDAAYLTCAFPDFPDAVVEQVKEGGRLLGPVGEATQHLVLTEKEEGEDGNLDREPQEPVWFVRARGSEDAGEERDEDRDEFDEIRGVEDDP